MQVRFRAPFTMALICLTLLLSMTLAACGGTTTNPTKTLTDVSIGLGYIPDIQFAPFYVAVSKGYYKDAGLNVTLNHGIVTDLFGEMLSGKDTFVFAGGDETLEARSKGLPVINVATVFQKYPVSIIVPSSSSITTLADLKGHTIGIPGAYGSSYTGLLALLAKGGLTTNDVKIESIGYTQVTALKTGKVDAVVGYTNNEPLQLAALGMQVRTFDVSDYQPMISNGIITTETTLKNKEDLVHNFVAATIKGLNEVINNQSEALNISKSFIPAMDATKAKAELAATIPIYQGNSGHTLGYNDSTTWASMATFLASINLIPASLDVKKAYVNVL